MRRRADHSVKWTANSCSVVFPPLCSGAASLRNEAFMDTGVILINGPSAVGKSAIAAEVASVMPGVSSYFW